MSTENTPPASTDADKPIDAFTLSDAEFQSGWARLGKEPLARSPRSEPKPADAKPSDADADTENIDAYALSDSEFRDRWSIAWHPKAGDGHPIKRLTSWGHDPNSPPRDEEGRFRKQGQRARFPRTGLAEKI